MPRKALSAVVAVVLLLMMTVGAAGLAYVFISGLQKSGEESTQGQLSSIQEAISSCMAIDSVYSNKVYLRNCGDGIIDNASLKVYMDDEPISLSMSPSKIEKGEVGTVSLYGIWDLAPYTNHKLKIQNDATSVSKRVSAEPRKDDLAGGWDFDDGSGTSARDWSGNGNGGTLMNGPVWTAGKFGGGLQFSGSNYVSASAGSGTINNKITISMWINFANLANQQNYFSFRDASNNRLVPWKSTGNELRFWSNNWDIGSGFTVSAGSWYHVVDVYDGSNGYIYINGIPKNIQPVAAFTLANNAQTVYIGADPGLPANGIIDDVRIYSKALSPDELVNLKAV